MHQKIQRHNNDGSSRTSSYQVTEKDNEIDLLNTCAICWSRGMIIDKIPATAFIAQSCAILCDGKACTAVFTI